MIRSPNLSNLFYKALRKRLDEDALQQVYKSSVFTLRQYQFDVNNVDQFIDKIFTTVDGQVADLNFTTTKTENIEKSPPKQSTIPIPSRKGASKMIELSKIVSQVSKKREDLLSQSQTLTISKNWTRPSSPVNPVKKGLSGVTSMMDTNSQLGSPCSKTKQQQYQPQIILDPKDVVFFGSMNTDKKIDSGSISLAAKTENNNSVLGAQSWQLKSFPCSPTNDSFTRQPSESRRLSMTMRDELLTGQTAACSFDRRTSQTSLHHEKS